MYIVARLLVNLPFSVWSRKQPHMGTQSGWTTVFAALRDRIDSSLLPPCQVCILGLCSLITLPDDVLPPEIHNGMGQILGGVVKLLVGLKSQEESLAQVSIDVRAICCLWAVHVFHCFACKWRILPAVELTSSFSPSLRCDVWKAVV